MFDYLNEQWMSLLRFSVLSALFLINLGSQVRLVLFNVKSDKKNEQHCVHTVTSSLVVLANLFYLLTWIPYIGLSMYDTNWSAVNGLEQCVLQYLTSSIFTTLLLSVLVIRKIYGCFTCQNAKIISLALVFAWVLPQQAYLTIMEIFGIDKLSPFESSNRLIPFRSYFASELVEFEGNQTVSTNLFDTNDFNLTSGTFMICVHRLSSQIISQLSWQYVVLVIPLTAIVFLSFIGQALNKNFFSYNDKCINKNCECKDDLFISSCLYFNLTWLLVLRPLIILNTLILKHTKSLKQQLHLDLGTHLILILCVFFFPFSSQGGFRTMKLKPLANYHVNKTPLLRKRRPHDHSPSNRSPNLSTSPNLSSNPPSDVLSSNLFASSALQSGGLPTNVLPPNMLTSPSNLSPSISPNAILAMHQQYLLSRNGYGGNFGANFNNLSNLSNLNNLTNLSNLNHLNNLNHTYSNADDGSDYHAFGNVDNFYRY